AWFCIPRLKFSSFRSGAAQVAGIIFPLPAFSFVLQRPIKKHRISGAFEIARPAQCRGDLCPDPDPDPVLENARPTEETTTPPSPG
ncbi:hypothetical protein ABTF01_20170, partial [Acinetobacter baumannii]